MKRVVLALLLAWCTGIAGAAELTSCLPLLPVALTVRIGDTAPVQALLSGGSAPALQVVDAHSGALLWSADAGSPAVQRFADMSAPFANSLIALDTDRDGLADRLYAGDLAGRLWRFDLHNGATADAWASGGVFADFSNAAGRGFLAPPDVVLMNPPGALPWFSIALGTAAPGHAGADNRLYVLRDAAPFDAWSDSQYRDWRPLQESDLARSTNTNQPADDALPAGWFIALGSGDVLTAAVTVAGRTTFAIADSLAGCRSAFSIATLDLTQRRPLPDANGDWRTTLAGDLTIDTAFALAVDSTDTQTTSARCLFGESHVAACDVDMRPRRTWWRREDAE
jgi:hypothetical protein